MSKSVALALGLLFSPAAVAQVQAPFCLVSNSGFASCFYYSIDACRQAASSMGGMCSANIQPPSPSPYQQPVQPVQIQTPDIAGSFQRGQALGAEQRRFQQEHEAKMRLMDAQTQAAQQPRFWQQPASTPEPATQGEYYRAIYRCGDSPEYTPVPAPGCVVVSVYP